MKLRRGRRALKKGVNRDLIGRDGKDKIRYNDEGINVRPNFIECMYFQVEFMVEHNATGVGEFFMVNSRKEALLQTKCIRGFQLGKLGTGACVIWKML